MQLLHVKLKMSHLLSSRWRRGGRVERVREGGTTLSWGESISQILLSQWAWDGNSRRESLVAPVWICMVSVRLHQCTFA
jgi:hypothetical protein